VVDGTGDTVCANVTASGGRWTCTSSKSFEPGDHTLTATAVDAAGNHSDPSEPTTVTIDLTAPAAPTIDHPADGTEISDSTPTLSGTADSGTTVTVQSGTTTLCTAVAVDGAWSCDSLRLSDGKHTVTPTSVDDAGNATTGDPVTFTVDTSAPLAPVIVRPANGSTINTAKPELSGTADHDSQVSIEDQNGDPLCTDVLVGSDGQWACTSKRSYEDGLLTFTPRAVDAAGNETAGEAVTVTLDTAAPDAPTITTPVDGTETQHTSLDVAGTATAGDTVTVEDTTGNVVCGPVVADEGAWSCGSVSFTEGSHVLIAIARDLAGNSARSAETRLVVDTTAPDAPRGVVCAEGAGGTATCSGADAPPAGTVFIHDAADRQVCETTANADGSWTCVSDGPVPEYPVVVQYRDVAGNRSATTVMPIPPSIVRPVDGTLTNEARPTISGRSGAADGTTVAVRDEHGTLICEATVSAGDWTCIPSRPLAEGDPTLIASTSDAAGNVFAGRPVEVTVDTIAPAAPTGSCVRNADSTVTCTGRAEPGSAVVVTDPAGAEVCHATATRGGDWSCTSSRAVTAGKLTARATDAAGNTSRPATLPVRDAGTGVPPGSGGSGGGGIGVPGDAAGVRPGGSGAASGGSGGASGGAHGGRLAFTGSADTTALVLAGLVLVAAGGLLRARRRRH
jgi:LPXTG-motif cell wall-anchored protein